MAMPRWIVAHPVKIALLLIVGLPLLLYAIIAARFYTASPNIARNYMQEINDALPTEGEPAWSGLVDAWATFYAAPVEIRNSIWGNDAFDPQTHADTVAWLAAHPEHVPAIRDAARKPRLGLRFTDATDPVYARASMPDYAPEEPSENPVLWTIVLPHLSVVRQHARTVAAHALIAAEAGQTDDAIADIRAILDLANHAADPPFYITQLVRAAIVALAADTAVRLVHEHADRFTPPQLDELDRTLASFDPASLVLDMRFEHMGFDDTLQRVYTDDGRGNGRLTPEGARLLAEMVCSTPEVIPNWARYIPTAPLFAMGFPSRRTLNEAYHTHLDAARQRAATPIWQWGPMPDLADPAEAARGERLLLVWLPVSFRAGVESERARMLLEGARVAVALHRYRAEHGRYPETLDQLIPAWLEQHPTDRATGRPLPYRVTEGRPLLYSVGLDGIDEDGRHTDEAWKTWRPRPTTGAHEPRGDFQIYPPHEPTPN
ncbi:MAG: hypothetical protein EA378_08840 [Phycisphaerales bacterium]|nr:MAG: hypothetical protein EA378_08840 [Phycisphaerales bacterium]